LAHLQQGGITAGHVRQISGSEFQQSDIGRWIIPHNIRVYAVSVTCLCDHPRPSGNHVTVGHGIAIGGH
jgi:hypothetical protein